MQALEELDYRLRVILPEEYQDSYETLEPAPMKSAGLKFADDGAVAWDEIWGSFCDLAMAGGPPHKGALLGPGTQAEIAAAPARYQEVVDEICRGITMVTELPADGSPTPGWVRVKCYSDVMAAWLLRAITMENVAVRADGRWIDLPASPGFRLEKEIKNVITVIAKTCHYWMGHMPREQKESIAILFASIAAAEPLIAPADARSWRGVACDSVHAAVWLMRALVVSNVLARREGTTLFVPINPDSDPGGVRVSASVDEFRRLAPADRVS
jgi:hypothetical protein